MPMKQQNFTLQQPDYYVKVKGAKQGWFPGTSAYQQDQIDVHSWEWSVGSARDAMTGLASGKRQYSTVKITIAIGKVSPLFFQASVTNELLEEVHLSCLRADNQGGYAKYYGIKVTNANISKYTENAGAKLQDVNSNIPVMFSEIEISFNAIQVEYTGPGGNTLAADSLSKGGSKI